MTTGKHFPGHGDADADSHIDLPTITLARETLATVHLPPFRAAVEEDIDGIMTAHVAVVGIEGAGAPPATLSPHFVTTVLRDELGFEGLVFTDAMNMGAIAKRYGEAESLVRALEAGADVLLYPIDPCRAARAVEEAVREGRLSEERIDKSVRRVLKAKARVGLHVERTVNLESITQRVGVRSHHALAQAVAERSITLVRDEGDRVPFASHVRQILAVTYADTSDLVAGLAFDEELSAQRASTNGWTVDSMRADPRTTAEEFEHIQERALEADVVVISVYVSPQNYKGSVAAGASFAQFVESFAACGVPFVVVSLGSPYVLHEFPSVPSYLLAWGGEAVSQRAAARALAGRAAIRGTLPISLPPYHKRGAGVHRAALGTAAWHGPEDASP